MNRNRVRLEIGDKVYSGETVYYQDNPKKGIITRITINENDEKTYEIDGVKYYYEENIFLRSDKESVNWMFGKIRESLQSKIRSHQSELRNLDKLIIEHDSEAKL